MESSVTSSDVRTEGNSSSEDMSVSMDAFIVLNVHSIGNSSSAENVAGLTTDANAAGLQISFGPATFLTETEPEAADYFVSA